MKAFQFRLHAVLTLREQAEHTAQRRCAEAYTAVEKVAAQLRSADAEIAAAREVHRRQLDAGANAEEVEHLRQYTLFLLDRRTQIARELTDAEAQAEAARVGLVLAQQQRETLERLCHQQRRGHDYRAARAEQKLLDELAAKGPAFASHRGCGSNFQSEL